MTKIKTITVHKIVVLLALTGAAISALGRGDSLAYAGIAYYIVCAAAVLMNDRRSKYILWGAVVVHAFLVGYSIWFWQKTGIIPCHYCMTAAGFALLAATAWQRFSLAIFPALLIAVAWYTWPLVSYNNYQPIQKTGSSAIVQPSEKDITSTQKETQTESSDETQVKETDPVVEEVTKQTSKESKKNQLKTKENKPIESTPVQEPASTEQPQVTKTDNISTKSGETTSESNLDSTPVDQDDNDSDLTPEQNPQPESA